ncbi:MAG: hypothetical protein AAFV53_37045 [Myxococcota bacterium]
MTVRYVLLACLLPMTVGGLVYLLFRDTGLLMFRWADALQLTPVLVDARAAVAPLSADVPDVLRFSLPDGAWVFSYTAFFARLWRDGPLWMRVFWIGLGPAMAIGGELGQLIPGFVPGTFDPLDLVFYVVAAVGALWVAYPAALRAAVSPEETPATAR